jgi:hypothetical protein
MGSPGVGGSIPPLAIVIPTQWLTPEKEPKDANPITDHIPLFSENSELSFELPPLTLLASVRYHPNPTPPKKCRRSKFLG